jgi:hypothetical protein
MTLQIILLLAVIVVGLVMWYRHEVIIDTEATVRLQSEHEHFHMHVELPPDITIQPGDTVHILSVPDLDTGRTEDGEMSYHSKVRLHKASWLQRQLTKNSSLVEVTELLEV